MEQKSIEYLEYINNQQNLIEVLNGKLDQLKATIALEQAKLDEAKANLLESMQKESINEFEDKEHRLFANVFNKTNVEYSNEKDVITTLKENGFSKFVKVKTTEALDKNPLKKEIKSNAKLEELLKPLIVETTTTWVVVTESENHTKMLEHIEENKKGK